MEVLKLFIEGQERKRLHADALRDVLEDNHRPILIQLAVAATPMATPICPMRTRRPSSAPAWKRNSATSGAQFSITVPAPMVVLDTLVNHDILVRAPDGSVGFQHQQFQDGMASFDVEGADAGRQDG